MTSLSISINQADLLKVEAMLSGIKNAVPRVISRSVNKTLIGVRTDSVREIGKVITPKAKVIRKTFKVHRATVSNLSAKVRSKGKPLGLIHFRARQLKRGVSLQVKKKKARSVIPHAFIRTITSHPNVWKRYYVNEKLFPVKPVKPGRKYGAMPKKYRLPIYRMAGPRVPDIMSNKPVMNAIQQKADKRLDKAFSHELEFMLSRL